jgi:glycosyltransferase involved in cell wall biosynthesis
MARLAEELKHAPASADRLRVLHLTAGKLYGGVETYLVTLARYRDLCPEMEPEFALCFAGRLSNELGAAQVPVLDLGTVRIRSPLSVMRARSRLRAYLRQRNYDVVVSHMSWPHAIFGPVIRASGIPLVFFLHGVADGRHWLDRWARKTPPDFAISAARFTFESLPRIFPGVPAAVIHYPVAKAVGCIGPSNRESIRREFDTPRDAVVIAQASRFDPYKGHKLHLEALAKLRDVPGWISWQVGGAQRPSEERYLAELRSFADAAGIGDRVRFVGQRSDVQQILAAADIHCQPNVAPEPFGIAFIEAGLAGLPVVTTAMGGALEAVDETTGILTPSGNSEALAKALSRLIDDRELRAKLGGAGSAKARALCDPRQQIRKLYETLTEVRASATQSRVVLGQA